MKSSTKSLIVPLIIMGIIAVTAYSCDKEGEVNTPGAVPTLTTSAVINISSDAATSGGNISDNYDSPVTARGVCWGTNPTPNTSGNKTVDGLGIGPFQSDMTGLSPDQTYYVRAYATNASGTGYGSALQFITLAGSTTVTDPDGNTYNTVTIGTQVWLKENLATTKYSDGSAIPHEPNGQGWQQMTTPAYTWYNDDYAQFGTVYGALYNWYVVDPASNGNRNVCPAGWHVPSKDEFAFLIEYLGGNVPAGGKMKETGTVHWQSVNVGATNESGFTGLGAGGLAANYSWNMYRYGSFWTTTPASSPENYAHELVLFHGDDWANERTTLRWVGMSVRCIKD